MKKESPELHKRKKELVVFFEKNKNKPLSSQELADHMKMGLPATYSLISAIEHGIPSYKDLPFQIKKERDQEHLNRFTLTLVPKTMPVQTQTKEQVQTQEQVQQVREVQQNISERQLAILSDILQGLTEQIFSLSTKVDKIIEKINTVNNAPVSNNDTSALTQKLARIDFVQEKLVEQITKLNDKLN